MTTKLIFLSHIHDERELAALIQAAVEDEFSGFVDVFVSSDGITIPAGANLLKRIELGLSTCIAALYLLSPTSTPRPWINFELGAVWVRNVVAEKNGGKEIPAIPLCHSGMKPSQLPAPANNLSGIEIGDAAQLETAFKSLQRAVGGRGSLRTNFDELAEKIRAYEVKNTVGAAYREIGALAKKDKGRLIDALKQVPAGQTITISLELEQGKSARLKELADGSLKGKMAFTAAGAAMVMMDHGSAWVDKVEITVNAAELLKHIQ